MRFWAPCQHLSPPSLWGTTFDPLETLTWFDLVNSWPESFRGRRREKCSIVLPLPLPLPPRIYNTRTTVLGFICDRLLWKIPEHRSFRWSFVTRIAHESGPFSSWLFVSRLMTIMDVVDNKRFGLYIFQWDVFWKVMTFTSINLRNFLFGLFLIPRSKENISYLCDFLF